MITSYNNTTQNVISDGPLTFTTDRILTGCTVIRNDNTFQLNKPGYYYVSFNANVSATTALGELTVALQNNGVTVPGAIASETATVVGNVSNLAFATIIRVFPSCCAIDNTTRLTLVNTGVDATYTNVNINITKIR